MISTEVDCELRNLQEIRKSGLHYSWLGVIYFGFVRLFVVFPRDNKDIQSNFHLRLSQTLDMTAVERT